MLAYAAPRRSAERRPAPHAMLVILVAHIAAIAAVMSARMDLPEKISRSPIMIDLIDAPKPPPPPDPQPQPRALPQPSQSTLDTPRVLIPVPQPRIDPVDTRPMPQPNLGPAIGPAITPPPPTLLPLPPRPIETVRTGPRFDTPQSALRPPYPASKLDSDEEAALKLRLTIDERGRVVAVDPVGRADPAFLASARRHLLARWRYQPATENGRAVASSTVITLRFEIQ